MGLTRAINERHQFVFEGWYIGDLEAEIEYWRRCVKHPGEYEVTDVGYCEDQVVIYEDLLERAEKAFEDQRTDKVNYEDGTWV